MLQLPTELKLEILQQLPCEDLFSVLTGCKELKALVHPLFYGHMLFTSRGYAFPHASIPYPFSDEPSTDGPAMLTDDERWDIIERLKSVTVPPHPQTMCADWLARKPAFFAPSTTEVLRIELARPSPGGVASCPHPVTCGDCNGCRESQGDENRNVNETVKTCGFPISQCEFIGALYETWPEKIVIKNYAVLLHGGCDDDTLPHMVTCASEFVVVLEPHSLPDNRPNESGQFADICPLGTDNVGITKLHFMIPDDVTDVTLVFMTRSPDAEWGPRCKHYCREWYEGRDPYFPCDCDACYWELCDEDNRTEQQSCWQSTFWRYLAGGIASTKARVTLVNYSAIIPDGVNRLPCASSLCASCARRTSHRRSTKRVLVRSDSSQWKVGSALAHGRRVRAEGARRLVRLYRDKGGRGQGRQASLVRCVKCSEEKLGQRTCHDVQPCSLEPTRPLVPSGKDAAQSPKLSIRSLAFLAYAIGDES